MKDRFVWDAGDLLVIEPGTKGDVAGHEFHGNQWTGGSGASTPAKLIKEATASLSPEARARAEAIVAKLGEAELAGLETDRVYEHNPAAPGQWDAARVLEQNKIIAEIKAENANIPNGHDAIVMGGLGGAGKTTVLTAGAKGTKGEDLLINTPDGPKTAEQVFGVTSVPGGSTREVDSTTTSHMNVNADSIKERMIEHGMGPNVEGLSPMEQASLMHEESSMIAKRLAADAMAEGKNIIYDVTLGSVSSGTDKIGALHDAGYKVGLAFVSVTPEHSIASALGRWQRGAEDYANGRGQGGRFVQPKTIAAGADTTGAYRSKNEAAFHALLEEPDARLRPDWHVKIDNQGNARRLVEASPPTV